MSIYKKIDAYRGEHNSLKTVYKVKNLQYYYRVSVYPDGAGFRADIEHCSSCYQNKWDIFAGDFYAKTELWTHRAALKYLNR